MNIVITGASKGIGYEAVKRFCQTPDHHVVAIARSKEGLMKLEQECKKQNPSCKLTVIDFDLSSKDLEKQLIPKIHAQFKTVDVLINNAAILLNKQFVEITDEEFENVYNSNVFGLFRLIQGLYPSMGKINKTHIVNIASMGGVQGSVKFAGLSAYSSSKAAVIGLTECLAEEFKDQNISVNCLAFGAVQTEMLSQAFPGFKAPVTAAEMGAYLADFSLNGHKFFNGKVIPVALTTP